MAAWLTHPPHHRRDLGATPRARHVRGPATHPLRDRWEETKREVQVLFEKACTEEYERRLDYYRTCGESGRRGAGEARSDPHPSYADEEREQRLAVVWAEIQRRVAAVLADKAAAEDSGSDESRADSSGR